MEQLPTPAMAETEVCDVQDLAVGEIKEFTVFGEKQCIVVKDESGSINAVSNKCTHYGANLAKGSYANGTVRCPWHGACFSMATGDIEDFPGLDSLHKFEVDVTPEGKVKIRGNPAAISGPRRQKRLCQRNPESDQVIIVVGGGGAGQAAVETLRQDGNFCGRILFVTKEDNLPYDRPKLSKALSTSAAAIALRTEAFFHDANIEILPGLEVTNVDLKEKNVTLSNGDKHKYTKLILCTGSTPNKLTVEGNDLDNIFVLRTPSDGNLIAEQGTGKDVVVIGTSFIGMEVAAFFADKAASVTVVGSSEKPFQKSLGKDVGTYLQKLHESKGVKFEMETNVAKFNGENGKVSGVVLKNGKTLPASVVVAGIGVKPNTAFLSNSGLELTDRGFVKVDKNLATTSSPDVFAAGDIAFFPLSCQNDLPVAIGHWGLAMTMGKCAALNAVGKVKTFDSVPFFWTAQYGKSIRYSGYCDSPDEIKLVGSVDEGNFCVYFCKEGKVKAVATLGKDPLAADFANLLGKGLSLAVSDIDSEWQKKLAEK